MGVIHSVGVGLYVAHLLIKPVRGLRYMNLQLANLLLVMGYDGIS